MNKLTKRVISGTYYGWPFRAHLSKTGLVVVADGPYGIEKKLFPGETILTATSVGVNLKFGDGRRLPAPKGKVSIIKDAFGYPMRVEHLEEANHIQK